MQKTSKVNEVFAATPPTWANPKDGSVFNRYQVRFANGDDLTFLARGEFKKQPGEDATYQIKNESMKTAKLIHEMKPQFSPQVFGKTNTGAKDDTVQKMIIRQSMYAAACQFYQQRNADEDEVIAFGDKLIQRVING